MAKSSVVRQLVEIILLTTIKKIQLVMAKWVHENCNAALVQLISAALIQQRLVPATRTTDKEWEGYL
jgi:hypothetical protein